MTAIQHRVLLGTQAKHLRADLARLAKAVEGARVLQPGASGPAVEALQRTLRGLDLYAGPTHGTYDAATLAAVHALEQQMHVAQDGNVDLAELTAMRKRQLFVKDGFQTAAHVGQKGTDIRGIESRLQHLGFNPGEVDGVFDAQLARAVRAYRQSDKAVPNAPKGIGPKVLHGLQRQVRTLESNLKELGRNPGKVDGFFTSKTEGAVRAFQRKHHLPATGIANARTRAAIAKAADAASPGVKRFIEIAKNQVGDPYVFGAQGPNAFDCSGLIYYALKHAGVDVSRKTAAGYQDQFGSHIGRANLKPGDLIFYWYPNTRGIPRGTASHIEIYLGHGKSMGTDNPSEGARVENVDWNAFLGGGRVKQLQG